jgi:hypothetical protein
LFVSGSQTHKETSNKRGKEEQRRARSTLNIVKYTADFRKERKREKEKRKKKEKSKN